MFVAIVEVVKVRIVVVVGGAFNSRVVVRVGDRIGEVVAYTQVRASKDAMDTSVELVVTAAIVRDSSFNATAVVGASIDVGNGVNPYTAAINESPLLAAWSRPRSNTR